MDYLVSGFFRSFGASLRFEISSRFPFLCAPADKHFKPCPGLPKQSEKFGL